MDIRNDELMHTGRSPSVCEEHNHINVAAGSEKEMIKSNLNKLLT